MVEEPMSAAMPVFLVPLLEHTPAAHLKLLAAWDGLSVESQITLLTVFREREQSISKDLALQALASPNAYVRYLAAVTVDDAAVTARGAQANGSADGNLIEPGGDQPAASLAARIQFDDNPLVRYALLERGSFLFGQLKDEKIDAYLSQPLEARLAMLRNLSDGDNFTRIIRRAVSGCVVPESEVVAMAKEYVGQPGNLNFADIEARDVGVACHLTEEFEALWRLVPDVPPAVGRALVAKLPTETASSDEVPEDVLDRMDRAVLTNLLSRDDARLDACRKEVALAHPLDKRTGYLVSAASHRWFDLTDEEFESLRQSDAERLAEMSAAQDMRVVVLKAAADFFHDRKSFSDGFEFEETYDGRLRQLKGRRRQYELRQLRLYMLAKELAGRESPDSRPVLNDDSEVWLQDYIVAGNTWGTYRKLAVAWGRRAGWNNSQRGKWKAVLPNLSDEVPDYQRPRGYEQVARSLRSMERRLAVIEKLATDARALGRSVVRAAMWVSIVWVAIFALRRVFG